MWQIKVASDYIRGIEVNKTKYILYKNDKNKGKKVA
jgi:hypothetical protein